MCGDFDMVGKLEPGCALSSVGAFFSTAGAGVFDRWIGECLRCCVKLDADAVGRMVAAACGLVDGVASAHPSMVERCVNMRTALRRFGESASEFVACESARDGEGDLDALYAARDRLRDAGDAFSAAVAQIAAGGMSNGEVPDLRMAFYEEAVARYAVDRNDAGQDVCFDDVLRDMFSDRKFALAFRRRSRAFDSMKKNFYNFAKRKGLKLPSVTVKMHRRG